MSIQICIKSPSASVQDYRCAMEKFVTILDLKQHLTSNYPGKPPADRQKLIFAGKLLSDSTPLGEIFKQQETNQVQNVHLVISKAPTPGVDFPAQTQRTFSPPIRAPNFNNLPNFNLQNANQMPNFNIPPNMNQNANQMPPNFNFPPHLNPMPNFAFPPNLTPEQLFLQQQFFQQQRIAMQQMQNQFRPQEQNQQQAQPIRRGPQEGQQPAREPWVWLIVKLAFMVYVFSQGGSTTRTVLLSIGAFMIFLYQTGLVRISAQQGNPNGEPQAAPRGFLNELVLPFFYSLLPNWQPNTQQEAPVAPVDPAVVPENMEQVVN